ADCVLLAGREDSEVVRRMSKRNATRETRANASDRARSIRTTRTRVWEVMRWMDELRSRMLTWQLPAGQLSRECRRLVGDHFRKLQILFPDFVLGLTDEPLRGVVLRARIGVQRSIVDAIEIVARARQRRP